ncbi:hypothetical protein NC652_019523 [Populus alba x Populus x berolinensis]|nr:hypothetical protein NC652_019523 [Populus alba x Populus x berolinensis]
MQMKGSSKRQNSWDENIVYTESVDLSSVENIV